MHLKGRLSTNLVVLVVILLLDGEKFIPLEEKLRARSQRATGGDALLLSVGSPSVQE
jgi:hypothetical protein